MHKLGIFGAIALSLLTTAGTVSAQEMVSAHSDEIISTLGYQDALVTASPDDVSAPDALDAGYTLVTLSGDDVYVAYLDIVQFSAALDEAAAVEQALAAGANDMPQAGWTYFGGTNTPNPGETASFVIDLAPGDYHWAASYYVPDQDAEEFMNLIPFTVTEAGADATPTAGAPEAAVTLEMTDDFQYIVSPDPVPTGPHIWELTNTGTDHAHHVVIFGTPEGVTARDIISEFNSLFAGTPPAGEPLIAQFVGAGYAALQSGGQTTWSEFNFAPGSYAVICFILDPETGRPHFLDGMVTTFTVE